MMKKARVLIVDDSVVVRRILCDVVSTEPDLEVAGYASNGRLGLDRIPQVNPDLVVLDLEMPVMDGLQALSAIRRDWPKLPVIMYSSLTLKGASATLDALAMGASDYLTKPNRIVSPSEAIRQVREALIPRIRSLCLPRGGNPGPPGVSKQAIKSSQEGGRRIELVAIGASTGGPNALADLLGGLPGGFPVPIAIVQHMPPIFTGMLAQRLTARTPIPTAEATEGDRPTRGGALLAPGDHHMALQREGAEVVVRLNRGPQENSCRPAVDVLFRTAAESYGPGVLAVVLTGMGQDGLRGAQEIRNQGGIVLAQDEASSVVWGMPGFVARAGLAEEVVPLSNLANAITRRVASSRPSSSATPPAMTEHARNP
jgi:two-component system chemotaxis response regulator CheB